MDKNQVKGIRAETKYLQLSNTVFRSEYPTFRTEKKLTDERLKKLCRKV